MVICVFDSFDPQTRERCGAAQTQEAVQKNSGGMKSSESTVCVVWYCRWIYWVNLGMTSWNQFSISYLVLVSLPDQIYLPTNDVDGGVFADIVGGCFINIGGVDNDSDNIRQVWIKKAALTPIKVTDSRWNSCLMERKGHQEFPQSHKNPVSASAMLTEKFLQIRNFFATSSLLAKEFPDTLQYKISR